MESGNYSEYIIPKNQPVKPDYPDYSVIESYGKLDKNGLKNLFVSSLKETPNPAEFYKAISANKSDNSAWLNPKIIADLKKVHQCFSKAIKEDEIEIVRNNIQQIRNETESKEVRGIIDNIFKNSFKDVYNWEKFSDYKQKADQNYNTIGRFMGGIEVTEEQKRSLNNHIIKNRKIFDILTSHLDQGTKRHRSIPRFLSRFISVQTLGFWNIHSSRRQDKIANFKTALATFEQEAVKNDIPEEIYTKIRSNMQLTLALTMLAGHPKKGEAQEAKELLTEAQDQGNNLAKLALTVDLKNLPRIDDQSDEEKETNYKEFIRSISEAGLDGLIDKKDIHEVFAYRTTSKASYEKKIKIFTTILSLAAFPLVWTVGAATALLGCIYFVLPAMVMIELIKHPELIWEALRQM